MHSHTSDSRPLHILFLTFNLEDNSTGRTYALWLLAERLGWRSDVVSPIGEHVWRPVADTAFAEKCVRLGNSDEDWNRLTQLAFDADLIVSVKAVPGSFDRGLELSRATGTPLLLDIDDPDLEGRLSLGAWPKMLVKTVLRPHTTRTLRKLRVAALTHRAITVSNPVLQETYGGTIVPHAREDTGVGAPHLTTSPTITFVGTVRSHKGLAEVREAVESLQSLGFRLVVTDIPPADAKPWERWVGPTTLADGMRLVREGDVVVIASRNSVMARAQLPAKLIDAMIAGRAIAISELAPLRWATGDASVRFRAGDVKSLEHALTELADPKRRASLGEAARARAMDQFSVPIVMQAFENACRLATGA